jgi:23S rRNA (cytosine1962-C5)-methyltransferase
MKNCGMRRNRVEPWIAMKDTISSLIIENAAARRVAEGACWLSGRDVVGRKPRLAGIVRLLDKRRRFVGQAFCSPGSPYFLRVITTNDEPIDRAFWQRRVREAHERRRRLFEITDAYRVIHAESDGIPGVIVDRYNDILAFQVSSAAAEGIRQDLLEILREEFEPAALVEKDDIAARDAEGLARIARIVAGTQTRTVIREGACRFDVDVLAGQKTGAYLDYRAFRLAARAFAQGECLDAFCYQGWFSCQIAPRAKRVVAVDASQAALDVAQRNALLNACANIEWVRADAFEFLERCDRAFDFVHLDPPAMAREQRHRAQAVRGYAKLLQEALRILRPGGVLMVSACSHRITERILETAVRDALAKAGRSCEVLFRGIQDVDHPVRRGLAESLYLKAIAVRVA